VKQVANLPDAEPTSPGRQLADPAEMRETAAALLNQQMWCWGYDIRRAAGNVLLLRGFKRWRPPQGTLGSTAYQLDMPPDRQVVLWGFGMFFGSRSDGGLFLKRYAFAPLWTAACDLRAALWRPEELPDFRPANNLAERTCLVGVLSAAMRWIAEYETWVQETLGLDYRRQCLREWPKTVAEAGNVPQQWLLFAEHCSELLAVAHASGE
jgi:hypothetical protein